MQEYNNLFAVNDQDFESQVLQSTLPVIVDFWAEWCPHCHTLAPVYRQLSTTYEGKLRFATINADESPRVGATFGVQGLPTLIVFHAGKPIARIVGPHPTRLQQHIERALAEISASQPSS
ncbi:thioredoxin family protein [Ktedonobacter robiniae]|uniref:Thioredoxin n=1 Tax=Ktedonobacter robiniae TaxID=2778365 RepID=A0ABQ3V2L7_9CHLR|nr:thioredoxin family protein [Ktedonobacter robiniae]GHO59406.1 thioredoxin [Ktedonobacter robiniae]